MFRYVMLFLAGVPVGWAVTFYNLHDHLSVAGCAVASTIFVTCAVYARPQKMPEQRLEKHLMGIRVVGREGER